jgi:hypothetical protein
VTCVTAFSQDGEASTQPGAETIPGLTGSSKTSPSEATFLNISQNMYGASAARSDSATDGRTVE